MRLYELLLEQDAETLARLAAEHLAPGESDDKATCCLNLEAVLRSPRHVRITLYNRRPPCFWIVRTALGNGGGISLSGLKEKATEETAKIVELVNNDMLAGPRASREIYRRVLTEAWRSDLELDPSEISLLGVLRQELGLTNVDHFLIEHHADLHQFWNTDHAFLDVLNGLRSSGLFHLKGTDLVLPRDLQSVVRQVLGIEASDSSCFRLYEHLNSADLAVALEKASMRTSGSKGERISRLVNAGVQPTAVLESTGLASLKALSAQLQLRTSGTKDALIDRIVDHFARSLDLQPEPEPPSSPEPEGRRLSSSAFNGLFGELRAYELSDILASIDARRVTGSKDHLIGLLAESPYSEETLLKKLDNRQLEALLRRFDLRVVGNKAERIERLVQHALA